MRFEELKMLANTLDFLFLAFKLGFSLKDSQNSRIEASVPAEYFLEVFFRGGLLTNKSELDANNFHKCKKCGAR